MFNWNDLRHFLAVARSGSTLAASRTLRVSQATVFRRVSVLEETLGIALFVRSASGYELTTRGRAVLPLAEAVEAAVSGFDEAVKAESRRLSGEVRLTTVESAANAWVIPALKRLHASHPDIAVEIVTSDSNLDLARGEADVAIRFGSRPTQETLIARHLTDLEECIYATRELAVELGRPVNYADLVRYPLVGNSASRIGFGNEWIVANVPGARIVQRANTLSAIISSVCAGMGAAILPSLIGDHLEGLVRLTPPIEELSTACWLVTTDVARRQPHIRAVIDCVVAQIQRTTHRAEQLTQSA